jgi:quercetin dioxygenase-like cupin family protein
MAQEAKPFTYKKPEFDGVKKTVLVCDSDLMRVHVQVVKNGGENNLHSHPGEDAFWYVINGAVKFYGEGDKVIGVYNKGEGILIPRGLNTGSRVRVQKRSRSYESAPGIRIRSCAASMPRR